MIDPQEQWALQIDVTNDCIRECANCTRLVGHYSLPFYMSVSDFERAAEALADFPTASPHTDRVKAKVVGMIGGEPLIHPEFPRLAAIMEQAIPERQYRGLWTGLVWQKTKYADLIRSVFGYVNNNEHNTECRHSPVLVALKDVEPDIEKRLAKINDCWLQRLWSGSITPKGFFFCEVAAAFDMVFDGPGGLPVEPGCWRRPLSDFQSQIDRWCHRCGIPLNLEGRRDGENCDDITESNLWELEDSPRVLAGRYVLYDTKASGKTDDQPWQYLRGK